jgi:aryl-alcohol dehydrogenase-like predicted oxidoreductase
MRHVEFAPLGRSVPVLGFGCASLGSRVDTKRGTAALARAFESGVSWFDVAPSYGDGNAETILGAFVAGKRSQVVLCTKVGMLPGRSSLTARVMKPVAQRALRIAPKLRHVVVRHRASPERVALTGAFIEASLQASLKRLRTDFVDVLALHEASLTDVEREDVLRALESVVSAGYARCISMAGDVRVGLRAVGLSEGIRILQLPNNPFEANVEMARKKMPAGRSVGFVTHSVYGHAGALDRLAELIGSNPDRCALFEEHGYCGAEREVAAAFLLDFALASNPEGVVLLSMYEPSHLRFNLDRVGASAARETVLALREQLGLRSEV